MEHVTETCTLFKACTEGFKKVHVLKSETVVDKWHRINYTCALVEPLVAMQHKSN
jgi:hypothetical protein